MRVMIAAIFAIVALAGLPVRAASSITCFQDCSRQGYDRAQCVTICEQHRERSGVGLFDQPGLPRNPYLDAIADPQPKGRQAAPPPVNIDPRCMDDCRARGHQYGYCRKQCAY